MDSDQMGGFELAKYYTQCAASGLASPFLGVAGSIGQPVLQTLGVAKGEKFSSENLNDFVSGTDGNFDSSPSGWGEGKGLGRRLEASVNVSHNSNDEERAGCRNAAGIGNAVGTVVLVTAFAVPAGVALAAAPIPFALGVGGAIAFKTAGQEPLQSSYQNLPQSKPTGFQR